MLLSPAVSDQTPFGFTSQQTDSSGLQYLRARYYDPDISQFIQADTTIPNPQIPEDWNLYTYTRDNPVNYTDPSGHYVDLCQMMPTKGLYEACVLARYQLEPINLFALGATVKGQQGCYTGPSAYRAPGFLEGADFYYGGWPMGLNGQEVVYDFATMERSNFSYFGGQIGSFVTFIGGSAYLGNVSGFPSNNALQQAYSGIFVTFSGGASTEKAIGAGASVFFSPGDPALNGRTFYVGLGLGVNWVVDLSAAVTNYSPDSPVTLYAHDGSVDRGKLVNDILRGAGSPFDFWKDTLESHGIPMQHPLATDYTSVQRWYDVMLANEYADAYEAMWKINHSGEP